MSKRSILVVDDDQSVRSYLSDFLSSCGYSVECAESGDQAVARLSAGVAPSLVILDIVMQGMNGIGVLENVKKISTRPIQQTAKSRVRPARSTGL